ncbi:uncharacterized protein SPPG_01399 [Spizellomyces punctatus DAOM BR117]|uniref:Uncharacterized protein n=1 Tax=Spizellomyces punctatus (strain DAOM BR117) TaxID=645134 RepID=A0A0L0HS49_SPIPD|nr:uncharacterized protein SPPG_01399 [Spizellomyces punctatus DAOM BR117]KND03948.1 hypothetical protein SPPG_01399 [Spizellomyces punctatus DAOM BR117]|eukprot:XP_016611987.1 hypothetical protein SPPG_01399 [Spizellomyces punctatus DAOM BR117]
MAANIPADNSDLSGIPSPFYTTDGQEKQYFDDYGSGDPPKTLLELSLISLSNALRNKPNWTSKIHNEEIVSKWRKELDAQGGIAEGAFEYVLEELKHDAVHAPTRFGVYGIHLADKLISPELEAKLVEQVKALENVPEHRKDWHPGSNNQVLDLVHPSLFPLVSDVTRGYTEEEAGKLTWQQFMGGGTTEAVAIQPLQKDSYGEKYWYSEKFQWLPSEFVVRDDGTTGITSYINNLHPRLHKPLYQTIAEIFSRFVPLFNNVLTDLRNPRDNVIKVDPFNWYTGEPDPDELDDEAYDEAHEEWWMTRTPISPTVPTYQPPSPAERVVTLNNRRLQVIVKLASIYLTPENPTYPGGVWHVEGMMNEKIIASGIYYYSVENTTLSSLGFRVAVCEPDYEQNDNRGVEMIYGLADEEALNQDLGSIETPQSRCIAFPNIYQHKLDSFSLIDPTKPGHRKILVFFLVDPSKRIVSTKRVPPQQDEWFRHEVADTVGAPFRNLPDFVTETIVENVPGRMTLKEAKVFREELMKERKYFVGKNNDEMFERQFSLCEH